MHNLLCLLIVDLKLTNLPHSLITKARLSSPQLVLSWSRETVMIHYKKEMLGFLG